MWFWILIVGLIGLGIYFAFTMRDIWQAGMRLYRQGQELPVVAAQFSLPERERVPIGDVYEDPQRVLEARAERKRIRQERADGRRRRLDGARKRWEELDETSFDSIGPEERERAQARVRKRRA